MAGFNAASGSHGDPRLAKLVPNWKPWAFHPLYITFISLLHILYIVGIQLVVNRHGNDETLITRIQQNETITDPQSIFVFDEGNMSAYLAWQHVPVALATILAILWESLDLAVRRLEPFHQLSSDEGGNVDNAMCLEYTGTFGFSVPFRALTRRHYAVVLSSSLYVTAAVIITTLAGGMVGIEWASLSYSSERTEGPKWATISINSGVVIATQAFHGLVAASGLSLAAILHLRKTGVYRDPKGIGGVASLISESDYIEGSVLNLFRQLPSFVHSKVAGAALRGIRFKLQHLPVIQADGSSRTVYQLTTTADPGYRVPHRMEDRRLCYDRWDATGFFLSKRAVFMAEVIIWLGQAAILGVLYQVAKVGGKVLGTDDGGSDSTKSTIAKMVFTLTVTVGGMVWQSIQRELQVFEPWRKLRKQKTRSRSIYGELVRSDIASLGLLGSAVLGTVRHSLVAAWAAFSVLTIHVATVFVPPLLELAYAAGLASRTPFPVKTFGVVSDTSGLALALTGVGIHLVIFCNMLFVMLSGRTKPFLPRRPTTLASQILYLCHSDKLLADFRGTSTMPTQKELAHRLDHLDRNCQFGWFYWQRGQGWCVGVDEAVPGNQWYPFYWGAQLAQGTRYG